MKNLSIMERLNRALGHSISQQQPILSENKTEEEFRCLTGFNLDENGFAHPVHNGAGSCPYQYGTPAEPWHISDILEAIGQMATRIARQYSSGGWAKNTGGRMDQNRFDDLRQNALMAVVDALQRGMDRAEPNVQPTTWLSRIMRSAVHGGTSLAGGSEQRAARGRLGELARAKMPHEVEEIINSIPEKDRATHGMSMRKSAENPFGKYAPDIWGLGQKLLQTMKAGDPAQIKAVQRDIAKRSEEIYELSKTQIAGAATGVHDIYDVPHSGAAAKDFKKRHGKSVGLTIKGKGGEEVENPDIAPRPGQYKEHTSTLAGTETLNRVLDMGRRGVNIRGMGHVQLTTNEFRALIRLFGLADYPGKGTPEDPEIDPATGKPGSEWAKSGYQAMNAGAIAKELGFHATRASQLIGIAKGKSGKPVYNGDAFIKLQEIGWADEKGRIEESRLSPILYRATVRLSQIAEHYREHQIVVEEVDAIDQSVLDSVCRGIRLAALEVIFDHSYPAVNV